MRLRACLLIYTSRNYRYATHMHTKLNLRTPPPYSLIDRMLALAPAEESEIVWSRLPHTGAWARWCKLKPLAPRELAAFNARAAALASASVAVSSSGLGLLPPPPDAALFARLLKAVRAAVVRRGKEEETLVQDRRARKKVCVVCFVEGGLVVVRMDGRMVL